MINSEDKLIALKSEFSKMLMLEEPVSEKVFTAAINDYDYAFSLFVNRSNPNKLLALLDNPPVDVPKSRKELKSITNEDLIISASNALYLWAKSGFHYVTDDILAIRIQACISCSMLKEPEKLLQKIIGIPAARDEIEMKLGNKICTACGCSLKRKIRMISETCPQSTLQNESINRWGEPIA